MQDAKKVCSGEEEKDKRKRQKQPGNKRDGKNATASEVAVQQH